MKINEKLGVPNFIYPLIEHIYNIIEYNLEEGNINRIKPKNNAYLSFSTKIYLDEPNVHFDIINIFFNINISKSDNNIYSDENIVSGGGYLKTDISEEIDLKLEFIFTESALRGVSKIEDIYLLLKDCIETNKNKIMKILSHELKHVYDFHKNLFLDNHIDNDLNSVINTIPINEPVIREFIYNIYYSLCFENLTRATELYGELKSKGVTKKTFKDELLKNDIYQQLNSMKNFNKDKFISSIDMNHEDIKIVVKEMDIENTPNAFLDLLYNNLIKKSLLKSLIYNKFKNKIDNSLFIDDTDNEIDEYIRKLELKIKMLKNFDTFLLFIEKRFKFVANKTIRKISKIWNLFEYDSENDKMQHINKNINMKNVNEKNKNNLKFNLKYLKPLNLNIKLG
jgi:hypothetical protein